MARSRCRRCSNALSACICQWISPIENQTRVIILQHPDEQKKPLGTAKIVALSLQNCVLKVGADFTQDEDINRWVALKDPQVKILYPSESAVELQYWDSQTSAIESTIKPSTSLKKEARTLIVLDGTWRNTREILNLNPALKRLPTVRLLPESPSIYRIRKAPFKSSLSTVEAVTQALKTLEPSTEVESMMLCFRSMIDYQISRMGEAVYKKNYQSQ